MRSTSAQWAELVTTALLGTDRRPLHDDTADAPTAVLRQAARHGVLDRLGGPALGRTDRAAAAPVPEPQSQQQPQQQPQPPEVPVAPAQDHPEAPRSADRLLAELLRSPDPVLINCWLAACVEHRRVVAAVSWTRLARLAARSTAYDRALLGIALGPCGRWFLRQNPDWRRLASDAERTTRAAGDASSAAGPPTTEPATVAPATAEDVLADPERIFAEPQPWRPELVAAAFAVLGGEGETPPHRTYPSRLGVALPTALYPRIAEAGEFYVLSPDATPARRRTIRDRFVALELAAYARAAIQHAFSLTSTGFARAEIPHV